MAKLGWMEKMDVAFSQWCTSSFGFTGFEGMLMRSLQYDIILCMEWKHSQYYCPGGMEPTTAELYYDCVAPSYCWDIRFVYMANLVLYFLVPFLIKKLSYSRSVIANFGCKSLE